MNKFLALMAVILTTNTFGDDKVIYGQDNRKLLTNSDITQFNELARSTAAMVPDALLESAFGGLLTLINAKSLNDSRDEVCKDERFSDLAASALCTGFLVSNNLLVTAGHCAQTEFKCKTSKWIFDYKIDLLSNNIKRTYVNSDNVYSCKKIISHAYDRESKIDYAVIELDRRVPDRKPLKFRQAGKIKDKAPLVMIGHPSGLPTIIANGARVRDNDNELFFSANLDSFHGNSGSPVFNAKTKVVEGLLVRGATDYTYDEESECGRPYKCLDDGCIGEDVTRITIIPELYK